jgi:hypothetical protein
MKRIITSIATAVPLVLLGLSVPVVASAQATQTTQAVRTLHTSDSPHPYVRYCLSAIDDAIRDADIDTILDKVLHLPKAAKAYTIYSTGSDEAQLKYELNHKQYLSAPFSASRVLYDVLGLIPGTSKFWSIGTPATSCLEAAVVWDLQTGAAVGKQLREDVKKFLSWLLPAAPSGLTVRPDPSNGTVLLLTWHAHKASLLASILKPGFEVSNGVERRSAPAGSGAVHYTWTGLRPGSRVCFRVRATNALGDSAWDPNAAPWHVCARSSSAQPGPCTPKINAVGPTGATNYTTIEIIGSCFGTGNTTSRADSAYFRISDLTAGWNACWTGDPGTDQVTCNIPSWTNTTIVFDGFTGDYGQNGWVISDGDHIKIQVWNPQSGKGPATCDVIAGSSTSTNC